MNRIERKTIALSIMKKRRGIPEYPRSTNGSKSKHYDEMDRDLAKIKPQRIVMGRTNPRVMENEPLYEFAHVDTWDGIKHIVVETNYD